MRQTNGHLHVQAHASGQPGQEGGPGSALQDQSQPLLLDLLDDGRHHISDSVLHVAWADEHGAFLLAAATSAAVVIFSLRRCWTTFHFGHRIIIIIITVIFVTCVQSLNRNASKGSLLD
jgi:hypothetical protein